MRATLRTTLPLVGAALLACAATADQIRGEPGTMLYRVIERAYGPEIRLNDWRSDDARLVWAGGVLQVFTGDTAQVSRRDTPLPGGGDVELAVQLSFERMGDQGRVAVEFHCPGRGAPGFTLLADRQGIRVLHVGREVHTGPPLDTDRRAAHTVRMVTLDRDWAMWLGESLLAAGQMTPPYTQNEGYLRLQVTDADVRILSCEENFITHPEEPPAWERAELLYEEPFGAGALSENWVSVGEPAQAHEGAFRFMPMSNHVLRRRFSGPLAVDCVATPLPTEDYSAGVTDAIFIWMLDDPAGDLPETVAGLPDATLARLMPLPFYWVDMGGTNNQTTRFRRNPDRHLRRQFTDPARLLDRDRIYRVTLVQNGHFAEYWVNGEPWIRLRDSEPLTEGYIGFRAFVGGLEIRELRVWRIR